MFRGRMVALGVEGSPITGENPPHDRMWRDRIAHAAQGRPAASAAGLHFRVEPHRRVDLDNLVRPALAGLRDAGVFERGFRGLHTILATKQRSTAAGLRIELDSPGLQAGAAPGQTLLSVTGSVLPRDGDRLSKRIWRQDVARAYAARPVADEVWIDVAVNAMGSLEAVMKPVIDGLEPFLGRDPRAHLEFTPNDHLVTWLRVRREDRQAPPLTVQAGLIESTRI